MNKVEARLEETIEVIEEILAGGGEFRLCPRGRSMLPLIVEGRDAVVLKKCEQQDIRKHDMLFYRRSSGQFVLHRLVRIEKDGTYTMCGDAQTVWEKGIEYSQVIGFVDRLYRKGKCISLDAFPYRCYVRIWAFRPLRRCVIAVARGLRKAFRILRRNKGEN